MYNCIPIGKIAKYLTRAPDGTAVIDIECLLKENRITARQAVWLLSSFLSYHLLSLNDEAIYFRARDASTVEFGVFKKSNRSIETRRIFATTNTTGTDARRSLYILDRLQMESLQDIIQKC